MPVTFTCSCGKTLQVKDEFAGRRVRCPACQQPVSVPAADLGFEVVEDTKASPGFEVVEDTKASPPPTAKRLPIRAKAVAIVDDTPSKSRSRNQDQDEEDEDDRPKKKRRDEDEEEEDRPKKKPKFKAKKAVEKKPSHFATEQWVLNGGVGGGILAMVIAVVWFVVGLANDRLFFYPPILFVVGFVGLIKGLTQSGGD